MKFKERNLRGKPPSQGRWGLRRGAKSAPLTAARAGSLRRRKPLATELLSITYLDNNQGCVISGFGRPFGINSDEQQYLYITDMDLNTVFRITPDLKHITMLDPLAQCWLKEKTLGSDFEQIDIKKYQKAMHGPHAIEFDSYGRMYITTYYKPLVHVYDRQHARKLYEIGNKKSSFQLEGPASAFIGNNDKLYVSEYQKNVIVCYHLNGDFINVITGAEHGAKWSFDRLHMVKVGPDNFLYCVDTWSHRIQKYTLDGRFVAYLGYTSNDQNNTGWKQEGTAIATENENGFSSPVSISFSDDEMAIADWGNNRIQIFTLSGRLKLTIDQNVCCLKKPYDAQYWQSKLVIADSHNHRIFILNKDFLFYNYLHE